MVCAVGLVSAALGKLKPPRPPGSVPTADRSRGLQVCFAFAGVVAAAILLGSLLVVPVVCGLCMMAIAVLLLLAVAVAGLDSYSTARTVGKEGVQGG